MFFTKSGQGDRLCNLSRESFPALYSCHNAHIGAYLFDIESRLEKFLACLLLGAIERIS